MPKARHRKRIRTTRLESSDAPVAGTSHASNDAEGAKTGAKKVGKKESEVTNLLEKLRSDQVEERIWASSALSGLLLTLPAVTLRLLLSKNLIGLLIERLTDPSDSVVVESLGALRNLAVSSPPSVLSEIHNKRVLLPLTSTHLPLLSKLVTSLLGPPPAKIVAPLPSTAEQRRESEEMNENVEGRRRLGWDWIENVLTLLWCLAESNTKILASLNGVGKELVEFLMLFLKEENIGIVGVGAGEGMEVEGPKKGKKTVSPPRGRVPLFVATAAAHALHALVSSNPPAQAHLTPTHLLTLSGLLSTPSPPSAPLPKSNALSQSHPATAASDEDDWSAVRVLSFGVLLELSKKRKTGDSEERERELKAVLKGNEHVLMGLLKSDLKRVAESSREQSALVDPAPAPGAAPSVAALKLESFEKKLSTLQLSLEVLGEWCTVLDTAGVADEVEDEEEEWGGIPMEHDEDSMGDDNDEEDVGIIRRKPEDDVDMDEGGNLEGDEVKAGEASLELGPSALTLFTELPTLLLALTERTSLSFVPSQAAVTPADTRIPTSSNAISTTPHVPQPLLGISEILTTIHVRALECLNNLYITFARSLASSSTSSSGALLESESFQGDLQKSWEGCMEMVLKCLETEVTSVSVEKKKTEVAGEEVELETEERKMESVMAGVGVAWGLARIGLGEGGNLVVGPSATPFLISVFSHPYATSPTPSGEAIRVRVAGALGWIGRRTGISPAENEVIGSFLLSVLPNGKQPSPLNPTPEVLLQVIDSFIDLYSDEEAPCDVPVFRRKAFLPKIENSISGVRAAAKKIDRKKFPELRSRTDGALENLVAFVQYRKEIGA